MSDNPPPFFTNCNADGKSNDLLKRISVFLPQIDEANKKLKDSSGQIDVNLAVDKDDSDSESDEVSTESEQNDSTQIELKVSLGNFDQNPIALLEENAKDSMEEIESKILDTKSCLDTADGHKKKKEDLVRNMLMTKNDADKDQRLCTKTAIKEPRKKLIEELN